MRNYLRTAALVLLSAGVWHSSAMAFPDNLEDPDTDTSNEAYIGEIFKNGSYGQYIIWGVGPGQSPCYFEQIGDATGLDNNKWVFGLGGGDWIQTVSGEGLTFCGYSIAPLKHNGYWVVLSGEDDISSVDGSQDYLLIYDANDAIYGDGGDDRLFTFAGYSVAGGEYGNDLINAFGSGSGGWYSGLDGNDCLSIDTSQSPAGQICSDGTDQWHGPGTRPSDCESTVSGCPW